MFKSAILVILFMFAGASINADKKIVCYYGSWSVYRPGRGKCEVSDINPALCTHLIYSFIGLTTDANVKISDSWMDLPSGLDGYGKFTRLRQLSPSTKVMIAMGGWNEGSIKYSQMAADPSLRAKFIQNVVKFLQLYNFDGFDLDWEYPNQRGGSPSDKDNFVVLLKELRQEFDKHGFILSVAVAAVESSAFQSYHISKISEYVHFLNLMTYDFNGSWNRYTGMNAALYPGQGDSAHQAKLTVDMAVRYWLSEGAPPDKIILGIPTYGRSFTLADPSRTEVGAPATGPGNAGPYTREAGILGYNEICEYLNNQNWSVKRYSDYRTPVAIKGNQWVGYDDVTSVEEKAKYIVSKKLGGAMIWSIETDDFRGTCGPKYPLLTTLNHVLRGDAPVLTSSAKPPSPDVTTAPSPSEPPKFECKAEGFFRDPKDCSIFYQCQIMGDKYLTYKFQCAAGLVFDLMSNSCNYASLVSDC